MGPALALALVAIGAAPDRAADTKARAAAIDAAVRAYQIAEHIPGVSVAIASDGGIAWTGTFGFADLEHRVPVTADTVFRTASTLKAITAAAVHRLAEQGRIDLDAPVQRYCPAFPAKPWPVTARQLLVHQGGVRSSTGADVFNRAHFATVADAVKRFADAPLQSEPGTAVVYSNEGYVLLACAVEGASGEPYDRYVERAILRPAGMTSTFAEDVYRVMPHLARSYLVRTEENTKQWEGLWTPAHLASTRVGEPAVADPVDPSWAPGAGNYRSTPADMLRFVLALQRGVIVGEATRRATLEDVRTPDGQATGRSAGAWLVGDVDGEPAAWILGSDWNGSFGVMTLPGRGCAVAIASNVEFNQPTRLARDITRTWCLGPGR